MEEQILVVPRNVLFGPANGRYFNGFLRSKSSPAFEKIIKENFEFRQRSKAEEDTSYQQIIPYIVFRYGKKLFVYKRLKAGGEKRLHNLHSLGIGGHINPHDDGKDIIRDALKRELEEEIIYPYPYSIKLLGYINDDSNAVGRVHFGVVFLIEGSVPDIKVRETESLEGRLMEKKEIAKIAHEFENWSAILWEQIRKEI